MVMRARGRTGFTLIELIVVMAVIGVLLTLAAPRYFGALEKSKETVLKENLYRMREAIGKYHDDKGRYPDSLEALAREKYLRAIPLDPMTDSARSWVVVPSKTSPPGVYDVRSGAPGKASDGSAYADW